jgi:hypothetical protein
MNDNPGDQRSLGHSSEGVPASPPDLSAAGLSSTRDADIERYSDQPRAVEMPKRPPRTIFSLLLFFLMALAFLAGAALVGKTILNQ